MRILHTADWHLGQTLNNWSRDAEHRVWLQDLADVIEDERVDVLLVAGDVYDGINPSGDSQKILYDALAEFRRRRPALITIMTSGNHDPSGRLEAPAAILGSLGCHVVGTISRVHGDLDVNKHLIPLPGPDGSPCAHVMAIPFLRASDYPGMTFTRDEDHESPIVLAARRLHRDLFDEVRDIVAGKPIIAMGHLHCLGGEETLDAERRILIGGESALPPDTFPAEVGYVALGHLHKPQNIDGGRIRFSGSPFPLSLTEAGYRHGVTLIDIDGGTITHRHHEMPRPAGFHRVPQEGGCEVSELLALLQQLPLDVGAEPDLRPFIHVSLTATGPASVALTEAAQMIQGFPVRLAGIRVLREDLDDEIGLTALSLSDISVEDLFARAFLKVNGTEPEARHLAAFNEIAGTI